MLHSKIFSPDSLELKSTPPDFSTDYVKVRKKIIFKLNKNYLKAYCWNELKHRREDGNFTDLKHYAFYPYILVLLSAILYLYKMSWRSRRFYKLSPYGKMYKIFMSTLSEETRESIIV